MTVLSLRGIPIVYYKNVYSLNKKELDTLKKTKYRPPKEGHYLSETVTLLENKTFVSFKKFIIESAEKYTRDILGIKDQIYLTQSWSTLNPTNARHQIHSHPNTFISLVYYAQCKSGALQFLLDNSSIQEGFNFQYTIDKFTTFNSQSWTLPMEPGDIVLFPGHIRHGSALNKSSESRIIVGANFFLKGKIGTKEDVSLRTL